MQSIIKFGVIYLSSNLFLMPNLLSESINKFELKEIPNFNLENIRKKIPSINDPFKSEDDYRYSQNPFENLSINLIGLFKINNEINAMIRTNKGIDNYQVGDIISNKAKIKEISIINKEIIVSDGIKNYSYKLDNQ